MHRPGHPAFRSTAAVAAVMLGLAAACSNDDDEPASGSVATTTTRSGGTLEVLTYNVAGLPQEISEENPAAHIPLISPLLEPFDIVLTQEDFDWWKPDGLASGLDFTHYHERLRADTTHEFATPVHPGPEAVGLDVDGRPDLQIGDGIGILSRLPLGDFEVQPWNGCFGGFDTSDGGAADCLAMKGFRVATMDLDGVPVDVYSLHGEAGGTEEDQRLQAEDFEQLAVFVAEHSEGRAVILGGDTNLHTDEEHPDGSDGADTEIWVRFLEATGLTDACEATDCPEPGSIDKIAYRSSDAVELHATGYDQPRATFTDADGADLSDHPPVTVTLTRRRR